MNQRQIKIILELWQNQGDFLTSAHFAENLGVSRRTVQTDLKEVKTVFENEKCAEILSVTSKGTCLKILDEEGLSSFINHLYQDTTVVTLNDPASRENQILLLLLNQYRPVSMMDIEDRLFISHSTLLNDLKRISETLAHYRLELVKSGNRLLITGSEIAKRQCLMENNAFFRHLNSNKNDLGDEKQISAIKNILMKVLLKYQYHIADTEIQNAILVLNIVIQRLSKRLYILPEDLVITDSLDEEQQLSSEVFDQLEKKFRIQPSVEEINYFALYLKGQNNERDSALITPEMDAFILHALEKIRDNFAIDFTDNINLRISLALHCTALSIRLKYNMQLNNNMLDYIKKTFPLGYDIAISFSMQLEEKYGKRLSDAETSLIAVHFYSSLLETNKRNGTRNVLVISSLKNSMTMLLRQTLLKWFSNSINRLTFISPMEMNEAILDDYDVYLTTEKGTFFDNGMAMYINPFPTNYDYMNIRLMMDGFQNINDIIDMFQEDLFFAEESGEKYAVIDKLCKAASEKYGLDTLHDEVFIREEMGSTYFGKNIAVPHPMHAVSSDTFVAVCETRTPMVWDDQNNQVNLVVLLCIGKNNPQAFQLWDYSAKIFRSEVFASRIIEDQSFTNFIKVLKEVLEADIKE